MADKYGIPAGGNTGSWGAHSYLGSYTLSWQETMAAIAAAGWPRKLWGMAGAVVAAESGRNPFVYNTFKMGHFGLFQISRSAWPDFFAPGGNGMGWVDPIANAKYGYKIYQKQGWGAWEGKSNGGYMAYYPAAMTASANFGRKVDAHKGGADLAFYQSFFTTKTREAYLKRVTNGDPAGAIGDAVNQQLGGALGDATDAVAGATVDTGSDVAAAIAPMSEFVSGLWNAITNPAIWMRMGYGVTGVVLVAGGLFLIVRERPAVQAATNMATKAVIKKVM